MKRLMIGAAVAAMSVSGFAGACDDPEVQTQCRAWDVKMSLKSLGPKKIKCTDSSDPCSDPTVSSVYYLDNVTRKLNGFLWICDYVCDDELQFNVALWEKSSKKAIIAYSSDNVQTVSASEVYAYGKKANKVAGTIEFAGEGYDPATGETFDGIAVTASGINGKIAKDGSTDCYIKSLSGYAAGTIAYNKPASVTVGGSSGGLCEDPEPATVCEEYLAKLIPFCGACCFEGWCEADDAPDMVPATGTWSMKYNKKASTGKYAVSKFLPIYAL